MNKKQKIVILAGFLIIVIMGLFPPWNHKIYITTKRYIETYAGYGLIFSPPSTEEGEFWIARIDVVRLLFQWILVGIITIGLAIIFKDENKIIDLKKIRDWLKFG